MKTCNLAIVVSTFLQLMSYCRCIHFVFCGNDFQIDKGLKANTLIVIQDVFVVFICQTQKLNIPHFLTRASKKNVTRIHFSYYYMR